MKTEIVSVIDRLTEMSEALEELHEIVQSLIQEALTLDQELNEEE